MVMQESGEMYLETILILSETHEFVRSIDICEYMNYSKPSISRAMGLLKENGYIEVDHKGHITLTQSGNEIAHKIYDRHLVLSRFFELIGVDKETAVNDACRIEHVLSDETFEALKKHLAKDYPEA